jgi:hypothetical protein
MRLRSTSTQRTYRYVRLSLLAVVLLIGVAVAVQMLSGPLPSLSAAYYTPARNAFVGGLVAVSLALLALSGRSIEQALLDVAAVLAPVIAFVPVPVRTGDVAGVLCPTDDACLPPAAAADLAAGMLTLVSVGAVILIAAVVLALVQRTLSPALALSLAIAAVLLSAVLAWWLAAPASFQRNGHYAATVGFFLLIATVAVLAAVRPAAATARRRRGLRAVYTVVAVGTVASLVFLVVVVTGGRAHGTSLVLLAESVALGLFAIFWLTQSVEFWDDPDPALLSTRRE